MYASDSKPAPILALLPLMRIFVEYLICKINSSFLKIEVLKIIEPIIGRSIFNHKFMYKSTIIHHEKGFAQIHTSVLDVLY